MGHKGQETLMEGDLKLVIMPPDKQVGEGHLGDFRRIPPQKIFDKGLMLKGEVFESWKDGRVGIQISDRGRQNMMFPGLHFL